MDKRVWALFAALAALKAVLLAIYGPIMTPDSGGYSGMAQAMLSNTAWIHDAGLKTSYTPAFVFRIIGYPAFLAAMMAITGAAWLYATVILQSALSLYASWMTLRLGDELGLSRNLSLLAVFFYATSLQLVLDQCILTDSLNASCVIIATVLLVSGARAGHPLSLSNALGAAILLSFAFLLREIMQAAIFLFVIFLAVRVFNTPRGQRMRCVAAAVLVLAVPLATVEAYRQWSFYRTGERFVTTGSQTAMMQALNWVAARHPDLISQDTPLDRTMRDKFKDYTFAEVIAANAALFAQGFTAIDISRMASARYISAWREHPLQMMSLFAAARESQAKIAVRTISAICETGEWAEKPLKCDDYRELYRTLFKSPSTMTAGQLAMFLAQSIQNVFSVAVFAAFLIGVPIFVLGAGFGAIPPVSFLSRSLLASFWLVYLGFCTAYILIHFESRYVAPVAPLCTFAGLFVLQESRRISWRRAKNG